MKLTVRRYLDLQFTELVYLIFTDRNSQIPIAAMNDYEFKMFLDQAQKEYNTSMDKGEHSK